MNKFFIQIKADLEAKKHVYIRCKVMAKQPKTEMVDQLEDGTYKVKVAAQPVRGQSNAELLRFLTRELGLSEARIVSGGRDKLKLIHLIS